MVKSDKFENVPSSFLLKTLERFRSFQTTTIEHEPTLKALSSKLQKSLSKLTALTALIRVIERSLHLTI